MNEQILDTLGERYPELKPVIPQIREAATLLIRCYANGGKILICGNGGSCADGDHIVGELMKGFENLRSLDSLLKEKLILAGGERGEYLSRKLQQGLPAISLMVHSALITAVANDIDGNLIFAQQVIGYGKPGDVLLAISTSGNSINVNDAVIAARAMDMKIIGMTGESGGKMGSMCDVLIAVPEKRTFKTQELHFPVYHALCLLVEEEFFGKEKSEGN